MKVVSPELWVEKFIKSATAGRMLSLKARRILLIGVSLILVTELIYASLLTYEGIKAIPTYQKAKELLDLSKRLDHNSEEYHGIFGCYRFEDKNYNLDTQHIAPKVSAYLRQYGFTPNPYACVTVKETSRQVHFEPQVWEELGIINPSSIDCGLELEAYTIQKNKIGKLMALPKFALLLLLFLTATWFLLRIIFWVKDAE